MRNNDGLTTILSEKEISEGKKYVADTSGRGVCWDCGFESRRNYGCQSLESCVIRYRFCNVPLTRPEES